MKRKCLLMKYTKRLLNNMNNSNLFLSQIVSFDICHIFIYLSYIDIDNIFSSY